MFQDNARLSAENANLTEKLASSERANGRLIQELDGVSLVNKTKILLLPVFFFSSNWLIERRFHVPYTRSHKIFIIASCRIQMAELESRCEALEESQRHSLTEQLNRMSAENLQLRDRTDELSAEIELLRGQLAVAKLILFLLLQSSF